MVICHVCNNDVDKFLVVPSKTRPKVFCICEDCARDIIGTHIDSGTGSSSSSSSSSPTPSSSILFASSTREYIPHTPNDSLPNETKVAEVYDMIDEYFSNLVMKYKLTYINMVDIATRLYYKILSHYIHDIVSFYAMSGVRGRREKKRREGGKGEGEGACEGCQCDEDMIFYT